MAARDLRRTAQTLAVGETTLTFDGQGEGIEYIVFDANLTATAVAVHLTDDGTTWIPLYKSGSAYSITIAASRSVTPNAPGDLKCLRQFRLVFGSSQATNPTVVAVYFRANQ